LIHYERRASGGRVLYILDKLSISTHTTAAERQRPKDTKNANSWEATESQVRRQKTWKTEYKWLQEVDKDVTSMGMRIAVSCIG
jgi:hypothetical protein